MEDDPRQLHQALLEWENEGGGAAMRVPEHARASPPEPPSGLDMRHRRGSLGPTPIANPLDDNASSAALHAHLNHLLDIRREEAPAAPAAASGEDQLGPHEDLERQPDGIPHLVIGLTALFSVALAAVLVGMFRTGPTLGSIASVVVAVIAIPLLVFRLGAKAEADRDHEHPSR